MADEVKLLKQFSREVRNAAGLERTPLHLKNILRERGCKSLFRTINALINDRDAMMSFCRSIMLRDNDEIPSSEELDL